MQDKENRDIVDSQGNVIKSIKDNNTQEYMNVINKFIKFLEISSLFQFYIIINNLT